MQSSTGGPTTAQKTSEGGAKVFDQVNQGPADATGFWGLIVTGPSECIGSRLGVVLCDEMIPSVIVRLVKPPFEPPDALEG